GLMPGAATPVGGVPLAGVEVLETGGVVVVAASVCAHASAGNAVIAIVSKTRRIPASNARIRLLLGRQGRPHKGRWKTSTTRASSNSPPIFPISGGLINPMAQPPK